MDRPELVSEVHRATELLGRAKRARVFCHRDADGLCGAAILSHLFASMGIDCRVSAHLPEDISKLKPVNGVNVFVDIGAGQLPELHSAFEGHDLLVVDHHAPRGDAPASIVHVNPERFGSNGSTEMSGAGAAYLVSREILGVTKTARLAVVGAIADRQDLLGELTGTNKEILGDAVSMGQVEVEKDVLLFGRESRPLHLALKSFQDPPVPGVSGSEYGAMQLLSDLNIPLRDDVGVRSLGSLTKEEKRRLASELVVRCITRTSPSATKYVPMLIIGSVYRLRRERAPLQYASEYATAVNSSARMGLSPDAIRMMLGGKGKECQRVLAGLKEYRKMLSKELRRMATAKISQGEGGYVQYFIAGETPRNLLGPVTGLALGSGMADPYRPLAGLAPGHRTKVSARCSKILVLEGIDLSDSIAAAAESVGGTGGGHRGAAGAFFPSGKEREFLRSFEAEMLASQSRRSRSA